MPVDRPSWFLQLIYKSLPYKILWYSSEKMSAKTKCTAEWTKTSAAVITVCPVLQSDFLKLQKNSRDFSHESLTMPKIRNGTFITYTILPSPLLIKILLILYSSMLSLILCLHSFYHKIPALPSTKKRILPLRFRISLNNYIVLYSYIWIILYYIVLYSYTWIIFGLFLNKFTDSSIFRRYWNERKESLCNQFWTYPDTIYQQNYHDWQYRRDTWQRYCRWTGI